MASPFTPPTLPGAAGYPLGLTGATAATRYVGATASGAPGSGTFAVGDFVIDQSGKVYVCTVAGSPGTWVAIGGGSLTSVDYTLSGDVTMTNADVFYDGPSGSFVAGTWLINWRVLLFAASSLSEAVTCKLWDGSTVYDEDELDTPALGSNVNFNIQGFGIVTLGSTTTLKVSVISVRPSLVIKRDVAYNSAGSHTATRLSGVKIA